LEEIHLEKLLLIAAIVNYLLEINRFLFSCGIGRGISPMSGDFIQVQLA
jgi:hypothetical protein